MPLSPVLHKHFCSITPPLSPGQEREVGCRTAAAGRELRPPSLLSCSLTSDLMLQNTALLAGEGSWHTITWDTRDRGSSRSQSGGNSGSREVLCHLTVHVWARPRDWEAVTRGILPYMGSLYTAECSREWILLQGHCGRVIRRNLSRI